MKTKIIAVAMAVLMAVFPLLVEAQEIKTADDLIKFFQNPDMADRVLIESYKSPDDSTITRIFSLDGSTTVVRTVKIMHNKTANTDIIDDATLKCNGEISDDKCEVFSERSSFDSNSKKVKVISRDKHKLSFKYKPNQQNPDVFINISDTTYFFEMPSTYTPVCRSVITKAQAEEKGIKLETFAGKKSGSFLATLFGVPLFAVSLLAPAIAPVVAPAVTGVSQAATTVGLGAAGAAVQGVAGGVGAKVMDGQGSKDSVNTIPECAFEEKK